MSKRGAGVVFCLISAILFSARYLSAAIFMSSVSSWNSELFQHALDYVGLPLLLFSIISLIVGILYLREDFPKKKDQ
jgi:hypothetical protein